MKKANKMPMFLVWMLAMLMLMSACAPAPSPSAQQPTQQPAEQTAAPSAQPSAEAPAEEAKPVRILSNVTGGKDEEEMKLWQQALSEAVGFEVIVERPASDYSNVMLQKLKNNEQYDLIYLGQDMVASLVQQGALMDITAMVEASPILGDTSNVLASEWDDIRIDGKIYSGFNKKEVHRAVNINKVVAEKAGIDVTKIEPTLDGYYEVFKAMKAVQGEGFYGLNAVIADAWDLQPWFSSVGIKAGIVYDQAGEMTVPYASEAALPVWEWLAKLYKEGLLDPDSLTNKSGDMRNKFQSGMTGVVTDWAAWTGLYNVNAGDQYPAQFEAFPLPGTKTPDGSYMLARGGASLFSVPVNALNPEGAIKVLEFFATQEGGDLLSIGIEGHDYKVEGGNVVLTEVGQSHGKDHGAPVPISEKFISRTGWNPGFEEAMKYLPYASIEVSNEFTPKFKEIVGKHGTQIISGSISPADGIKAMQEELKQAGVLK